MTGPTEPVVDETSRPKPSSVFIDAIQNLPESNSPGKIESTVKIF